MSFDCFKLDQRILAGVRSAGYTTPTPVQREAIPAVLSGRDVLATAQTGTGKTAAFVLPILQRLQKKPRGAIRALIIAPTRELTEQSHQAITLLGRNTRLRAMSIYGGVNIRPQIQNLGRGVDIVAACPGRLIDHLDRGTISLESVDVLVLDEADRMFDMGFLPDIKKIIRNLPASRQTLLFSATMPREIHRLARDVMRDPVRVRIGHEAPATTVSQEFFAVASDQKTSLLHTILGSSAATSVLVFTRTKHRAKRLAGQLQKTGVDAASLHGNLSQTRRQEALEGFRRGAYTVLVATDIAARGIDVAHISHVINYDMPDTAEAYTHRIGRTGRAEALGSACTFVTREDKALVRSLEHTLGVPLRLSSPVARGPSETLPTPRTQEAAPPSGHRTTGKRRNRPCRSGARRATPRCRSGERGTGGNRLDNSGASV